MVKYVLSFSSSSPTFMIFGDICVYFFLFYGIDIHGCLFMLFSVYRFKFFFVLIVDWAINMASCVP